MEISVYLNKPPGGTGIALTRTRPLGSLPFQAWLNEQIVAFCSTPEEAAEALAKAKLEEEKRRNE